MREQVNDLCCLYKWRGVHQLNNRYRLQTTRYDEDQVSKGRDKMPPLGNGLTVSCMPIITFFVRRHYKVRVLARLKAN